MPVVTLNYLNTKIVDTILVNSLPNNNYKSSSNVSISPDQDGLMKFDLGLIPNDAVINSATLRLTQYAAHNPPNMSVTEVFVFNVLSDWSVDNVTGATAPIYDTNIESSTYIFQGGAAGTPVEFNIKNLVQSWINGMDNFGFALTSNYISPTILNLMEVGTVAYRPTLTVDYTIPTENKLQVEFISKNETSYSSTLVVEQTLPSHVPGDLLVAFITHNGGLATPPEGWTHVSTDVVYSNILNSIYYRYSDGDDPTVTFGFNPAVVTCNLVTQVFRNVKMVHDKGLLNNNGNSATPKAHPLTVSDLQEQSLLITYNTFIVNGSAVESPSFERIGYLMANGLTLQSQMTYNHSKTSYNTDEMMVTCNSSARWGSKAISLEPITNPEPKITGEDEVRGYTIYPFSYDYSVNDDEIGFDISVSITLDDVEIDSIPIVVWDAPYSIDLSGLWGGLTLGDHSLKIIATDSEGGIGVRKIDFTKVDGLSRAVNLTEAQWKDLKYKKEHTLSIEVTDTEGNVVIESYTFQKILSDPATLEEVTQAIADSNEGLDIAKDNLEAAIREQDNTVVIPPNATYKELAVSVSEISNKKYESGTVTSSATTSAFQYSGSTGTVNLCTVTVTDLPFKPKLIILIQPNGANAGYETVYSEDNNILYPKEIKVSGMYNVSSSGSQTNYNLKGDAASAVVNEGQFVLPVRLANAPVKWRIWGE